MCNFSTPLCVLDPCIYKLPKSCFWMDLALICVLIHPWDNLGMFCVLISATFLILAEIYRPCYLFVSNLQFLLIL